VNGPARDRLKIPYGAGCFGPEAAPAPAIGRATRLLMRNVGRQVGGVSSKSVSGQPGRVTGIVVGEWAERSPWPPLAEPRGGGARAGGRRGGTAAGPAGGARRGSGAARGRAHGAVPFLRLTRPARRPFAGPRRWRPAAQQPPPPRAGPPRAAPPAAPRRRPDR